MKLSSVVRGLLLAALAIVWLGGARAEVSVDSLYGPTVSTIMMSVVEDPDPINGHSWQVFRSIPEERILNPDGMARGDGGPDIAYRAGTRWPVVVWAYNNGTERDIAFSEWNGQTWTPIELIASGDTDQRDPRIAVGPDGTLFVTWWQNGLFPDVFLATREPGSTTWSEPVEVTDFWSVGASPSVAMYEGEIKVSFETPYWNKRDLIVATDDAGAGSFSTETVAMANDWPPGNGTDNQGPAWTQQDLQAQMHHHDGHLWIEWKSGLDRMSYTEFDGTDWQEPVHLPWNDPTWLGVEMIRRVIRSEVLSD